MEILSKKMEFSIAMNALDGLIEVNDRGRITRYRYDSSHRSLCKINDDDLTYYPYQGQNEVAAIENEKITQLRVFGTPGDFAETL